MADFPFATSSGVPEADTTPVAVPVEAPIEKSKGRDPQLAPFEQAGLAELKKLKETNAVEQLGASSGDLVFQYMLGNPLTKDKRRVGTEKDASGKVLKDANGKSIGKDEPCSKVIGFVFKAMKDVSVPVVKGPKTTKTGYAPEDVSEKQYKAGDTIILTYLELFLLAIRPEYSLRFGAEVTNEDGTKTIDPVGFRVDIKTSTYTEHKSALPSLSPALAKGAPKDGMVDICQRRTSPSEPIVWTAPEYQEKFACFLERRGGKANVGRGAGVKNKRDSSIELAATCRAIIQDYTARNN